VLTAVCIRREMPGNCSLRPPRHPYLPTWSMSLVLATKTLKKFYQNIVPGREKILFKSVVLFIEAKSILHQK